MNKDQVKGQIKQVVGKAQEKAGQVTGSTDQQVKGIVKQDEGKLQETLGDVKEVLTDAVNDVKKGIARK
ncbi:CsbD family protein [Caenimonas terrae]|uniref:CsbD family protein n=1 Tax=Caenimonas terrae TaxID=696074 RepID=A0ABW0NJ11_9BURK